MLNVKIETCHSDAIIPYKERKGDGCLDLYPAFDEDYIEVQPGETELVPTGIKTAFSDEFVAKFEERGSIGSKGIALRAGVVDASYRGEWFVAVQNNNKNKPVLIAKYPDDWREEEAIILDYDDAIAQVDFKRVTEIDFDTVEDISKFKSNRGEDCLGSTN